MTDVKEPSMSEDTNATSGKDDYHRQQLLEEVIGKQFDPSSTNDARTQEGFVVRAMPCNDWSRSTEKWCRFMCLRYGNCHKIIVWIINKDFEITGGWCGWQRRFGVV